MRRLAAAAAIVAVAAPAAAIAIDEAPKITRKGAGTVKLGASFAKLRAQGKVGKQRPGCELSGPNTFGARLKSPLDGTVDLSRREPRKIRRITIRGGDAQAKGVKVGDPRSEVVDAFPHANVDATTEPLFELTLYKIPKRDGGRYWIAVSSRTDKVEIIGIPNIGFCE